MIHVIIQKKNGFTLVEMLIYMALLSLLFVGTIACASIIYHTQNKLQKETAINNNLLFISEIINQGLSVAVAPSINTIISSSTSKSVSVATSTKLELRFEHAIGNGITIRIFEFENKIVLNRDNLQNIPLTLNGLNISNTIFIFESSPTSTSNYIQLSFNIDGQQKRLVFSTP